MIAPSVSIRCRRSRRAGSLRILQILQDQTDQKLGLFRQQVTLSSFIWSLSSSREARRAPVGLWAARDWK